MTQKVQFPLFNQWTKRCIKKLVDFIGTESLTETSMLTSHFDYKIACQPVIQTLRREGKRGRQKSKDKNDRLSVKWSLFLMVLLVSGSVGKKRCLWLRRRRQRSKRPKCLSCVFSCGRQMHFLPVRLYLRLFLKREVTACWCFWSLLLLVSDLRWQSSLEMLTEGMSLTIDVTGRVETDEKQDRKETS